MCKDVHCGIMLFLQKKPKNKLGGKRNIYVEDWLNESKLFWTEMQLLKKTW